MKVYNKNDNIRSYGKNVFAVMDAFFSKYPKEYSKLYYHNLDSLSLIRCGILNNGIDSGDYDADNNIIYFVDNNSIGHELFHMASNDIDRKVMGINKTGEKNSALYEGMTEDLFIQAFNVEGDYAFGFEVLVSRVLSQIPDFYKYYFQPNYDKFIGLFNNQDIIINLMDNLDLYGEISNYVLTIYYLDKNIKAVNDKDKIELICTIENVIDDLMHIGYDNSDKVGMGIYFAKLFSSLRDENIKKLFQLFYPNYMNYANSAAKKLVR